MAQRRSRLAPILGVAALGWVCAMGWAGPPQAGPQEPGRRRIGPGGAPRAGAVQDELHAFQIYDTQAAGALVENAREHLAARRWSEALVDLQALIEGHRGEVLGASRPSPRPGRRPSLSDVHRGASEWAAGTLFALEGEARRLYQERYGDRAARALGAAMARGDRAALTAVARRWPATREALRAWWALGDLELERGDVGAGFAAWGRGMAQALGEPHLELEAPGAWLAALERLEARDGPDPAVRARVDFCIARLGAAENPGPAPPPAFASALAYGRDPGKLGRTRDTWPRPHALPDLTQHPFKRVAAANSLYPVRLGDTVFYSTSRSVHAVGAFTGEELWHTPPGMLGWSRVPHDRRREFEDAVDFEQSLVAPAAARGVVVAPLQIPFAFEDKDDYGDLNIIYIIPERRLFAFDAETGERLWDTQPPVFWNGESGTFAARMTIVGPPVISGTRLLVPTARHRGRIELHVGCFDLHSGELLWSSPLITGQRPLNMFGRLVKEYTAPPVRVVGDRVVVQTQLGSIACLDLFTGETLWQTLYDQIPIEPGNYYNDGSLNSVWHNMPPAVAGEVVVCAPYDGRALLGIDLESGAVLWSVTNIELCREADVEGSGRRHLVHTLIGADERRVYLFGEKLVAFSAPGGLAHEAPSRRAWVYPAREILRSAPLPVLTRDRIYVPRQAALDVIERRSGKQLDSIVWDGRRRGNLLLGDGMLFTLSAYHLNGFFEWEAMVRRARARRAATPDDPRAVNTLALLLHKRGLSATSTGDYKAASRFLDEAREELERLVDSESPAGELAANLHRVLRAEARNLRLAADTRGALGRLRRARPLAPTRLDLLDTLLEEQAILRSRNLEGWLEVMDRLHTELADLTVEVSVERGEGDAQSWAGHLAPTVALLGDEPDDRKTLELPVGLWVLLERSQVWSEGRQARDAGSVYTDLHAIVHAYRDQPLLDGTAGSWAAERIGELLARGRRTGYEPFERQAQELLEKAQAERDLSLLERIPLLYPHSHAAAASNDARIDLALAEGDAENVAGIVLGELPSYWHPASASEREVRHLLRLAQALGERGNLELRAGLTRRLARHHPDLEAELSPDPALPGGRRLAELARRWAVPSPPPLAAASATFDARIEPRASVRSSLPFLPLGEVPPGPDQEGHVILFCDGSRLVAYSDRGGSEPLWASEFDDGRGGDPLPTEFEGSFATSPGRVHVASLERVITLDRDTGRSLWSWNPRGRRLASLVQSDGVVVVRRELGRDRYLLTGLGASTGIFLWELTVLSERFHPWPVIGEGFLVLLPTGEGQAQVFDIFTGSATTSFELATSFRYTARSAWIEEGRLILPEFGAGRFPDRNHILAYDLDSGGRAWRVPLSGWADGDLELDQIFSWSGRHYLLLAGSQRRAPRGRGLYELNTHTGAVAHQPLVELLEDEEVIGAERHRRTRLDTPFLFCLRIGDDPAESLRVRAIHLRYGERWIGSLPRSFSRSPAREMPRPAVSDTTVALAHRPRTEQRGTRGRAVQLLLVDRSSGRRLSTRELDRNMWNTSAGVRFDVLGGSLFVCGAKEMEVMR